MQYNSSLRTPLSPNESVESASRPSTATSQAEDSRHMMNKLYDLRNSKNFTHDAVEVLFRLKQRGSTVEKEMFAGLVQYMSCFYIMSLIPSEMGDAGYDKTPAFCISVIASAVGCILVGVTTNFPFVVAPPTSIAIFYTQKLLQQNISHNGGGMGVLLSGILLIVCSWRPLGHFLTKLIPTPVQVGTAVGIGLLTVLTGALNTHIVISGENTVVERGNLTFQFVIVGIGFLMVNTCLFYCIKGEYIMPLGVCTLIWWIYDKDFPQALMKGPRVDTIVFGGEEYNDGAVYELGFSLLFLYLLSLSSSVASLGFAAGLIRPDGTLSRNRWLFIICGCVTCVSGYLGGPPVLVAPESITGILAGGRTGLSSLTCGWLFAITIFFEPVINKIPEVATAPIMFVIGMLMFTNVANINWTNIRESSSAFVILCFVPFTYSTLTGVIMGYCVYVGMGILSGELFYDILDMWCYYLVDEPPTALPPLSEATASSERPGGLSGEDLVNALAQTASPREGTVDQSVRVNMGIQDMSMRSKLPFFPTAASIRERVNRHSHITSSASRAGRISVTSDRHSTTMSPAGVGAGRSTLTGPVAADSQSVGESKSAVGNKDDHNSDDTSL